jgi:competence protein ComEC
LAFALMIAGGLWICLWTSRVRLAGIVPVGLGAIGAVTSATPDLLVTGDGRHVALVHDGTPLLLRERTGDYMRGTVAEAAGFDGDPETLEGRRFSHCTRDACVAVVESEEGAWRLLATRSPQRSDWVEITRACAEADIVVSDRWLPKACNPRWLKLDRKALAATGGVAIYLGREPRVLSVTQRVGGHPWGPTGLSSGE